MRGANEGGDGESLSLQDAAASAFGGAPETAARVSSHAKPAEAFARVEHATRPPSRRCNDAKKSRRIYGVSSFFFFSLTMTLRVRGKGGEGDQKKKKTVMKLSRVEDRRYAFCSSGGFL